MAGTYLYGWDSVNSKWVKLVCDATGKLKIDPTLILENPPTEDLATKAATSEWSYDHWKDASAHHAKYTDAESRASINNVIGSDGKMDANLTFDNRLILGVHTFYFSGQYSLSALGSVAYLAHEGNFKFWGKSRLSAFIDTIIKVHKTDHYVNIIDAEVLAADILTHKNIADAHHAKYTDLEAQTAVNMNGNLYWSCNGFHFDASNPATDDITKITSGYIIINANGIYLVASVFLPNGATVTSCKVYGNVAASAEDWSLIRLRLSDKATYSMGTAVINTEDTSISYETIDNSLYAYYINTSSMDTNDEVWGARIKYTL